MAKTEKSENSYRSILKGTSIFGGVQVFNILMAAVRVKFVAILLGPAGMGVAGLFASASTTIQQFASVGLNLAVVKEVGAGKADDKKLRDVLAAILPMFWLMSALGALVCVLFPTFLSNVTFGTADYAWPFMLLGAVVFFSVFGAGLMSVLQGLHEVRRLSKASVVGGTAGLFAGVPLYWAWGTSGIVPAMLVQAVCVFAWYWMSVKKSTPSDLPRFSKRTHLPVVKRLLLMGAILMSNDLIRNFAVYLVNVFVRKEGGMENVGFYQACNTMTAQYSAIVFTAMAMDYLPRLSAAADDNEEMCRVVGRQMEIVGLVVAPVVIAVILLAPFVIEVLQTKQYLVATPLLRWLALAVTVRALMYPLGYITFAKDNRKIFFWMESVGANVLTLALSCTLYHAFGLIGLGYAGVADCTICLLAYLCVNNRLYGYRPNKEAICIGLYAVCTSLLMLWITLHVQGLLQWAMGLTLLIASGCISIIMLKKRIRK